MDNFCNKTNIMQMTEAAQAGIVVAEVQKGRKSCWKLDLVNHAFENRFKRARL